MVGLNCLNFRFVLDLRPEIAFMAFNSVMAAVGARDDRRYQDSLEP